MSPLGGDPRKITARLEVQGALRAQRALENTREEVEQLGDEVQRTDRKMRRASLTTDLFSDKMKRLFFTVSGLQKLISIIKWPAMIGGMRLVVTLATQAAGALTGLASAIAPAAAGLAAIPSVAFAAFSSVGVLTLGLSGLKEVMAAATASNESFNDAIKAVPRALRPFAFQIRSIMPAFEQLRDVAINNLMPGLQAGFGALVSYLPTIRREVGFISNLFGQWGERWARIVQGQGFRADVGSLLGLNRELLQIGLRGLTNIAQAFRHITVVAIPLTRWMGRFALGLSEAFRGWARGQRTEGSPLEQFFMRARTSIQLLTRLFIGFGRVIMGIFNAAFPAGRKMLEFTTRTVERWADWTESKSGIKAIADFAASGIPVWKEFVRLIRDLALGIGEVSRGFDTAPFIRRIRTEFLPLIIDILKTATPRFLNSILDLALNLGRLFRIFGTETGPLRQLIDAWSGFTKVAVNLFEKHPLLKKFVVQYLALTALWKFSPGGILIRGLFGMGRALTGIATATAAGKSAGVIGFLKQIFGFRGGPPAPTTVPTGGPAGGGAGIAGGLSAAAALAAGLAGGQFMRAKAEDAGNDLGGRILKGIATTWENTPVLSTMFQALDAWGLKFESNADRQAAATRKLRGVLGGYIDKLEDIPGALSKGREATVRNLMKQGDFATALKILRERLLWVEKGAGGYTEAIASLRDAYDRLHHRGKYAQQDLERIDDKMFSLARQTMNAADKVDRLDRSLRGLPRNMQLQIQTNAGRLASSASQYADGPRLRGGGLVKIGRQLQRQGFSVGEHPAFGGVDPVHAPGSYHYQGRAIDVNWPGLDEPQRLSALFTRLARKGPTQLFFDGRGIPSPVGGHDDHLHLAMDRGGIVQGPATIRQGPILEAHIPLSGPNVSRMDGLGRPRTATVHIHPGAIQVNGVTDPVQVGKAVQRYISNVIARH
ncbi:MAG: hypothetical protein ABR529_15825 [Actinomycetota bacterium]